MTTTRRIILALSLAFPLSAGAMELRLPEGAQLAADDYEGYTSQRLPMGPYAGDEIASIWAEGVRRLEAWRAPGDVQTTLQVLEPLRDQLLSEGFEVLFECRDIDCGGFDFRYAQDLLPEPDMHVNLGDYRFLSAQRMTDTAPEYIALMVSRNRAGSFIHVTSIGPEDQAAELQPAVTSTKNASDFVLEIEPAMDFGEVLEHDGLAVLEDLNFETGSAALAEGDFPSIEALADYLNAKPEMTVSLVGHTDAVGSMQANFRLSKARAASVRARLIEDFGVSPSQVDAQGVGYLAPVASNLSEDGRMLNRRVEVVLTATN